MSPIADALNQGRSTGSHGILRRALLVSLLGVFALLVTRSAWLNDDAYITFRVLDHAVGGFGLRWNVIERVQVYTHPLWMLLMLAVVSLTRELFLTVVVLSIGCSLAAMAILAARNARSTGVGAALVFLALGSKVFVEYSTSGLETPLIALLLALFWWWWFSEDEPPVRRIAWLSVIAAAALLTRLDLLWLLAPAMLLLLLRTRTRAERLAWTAGAPLLAAWFLFSIAYYGFALPNTAYAKLNTGASRSDLFFQGVLYVTNFLQYDALSFAAILVATVLALLGGTWSMRVIGIGVLMHVAYVVNVGGDFMGGRFFLPTFVTTLAVLGRLPVPGTTALPVGAGLIALATLLPSSPVGLFGPGNPDVDHRGVADERACYPSQWLVNLDRERLREHRTRERVQFVDQPAISDVFSHCSVGRNAFSRGPWTHVIDECALTDPLLARLPARPGWRIGHYYRDVPAGYAETIRGGEDRFADRGVAEYYEKIRLVTQGPLWSLERWRAIVGLQFGRYTPLIAHLWKKQRSLSLASLSVPFAEGAAWDAPGAAVIGRSGVRVELGGRSTAAALELSTDGNDLYELTFLDGAVPIWQTMVLPRPGHSGMRVERVELPAGLRARGFDGVRVRPHQGDGAYSLGHLHLLAESGTAPAAAAQ